MAIAVNIETGSATWTIPDAEAGAGGPVNAYNGFIAAGATYAKSYADSIVGLMEYIQSDTDKLAAMQQALGTWDVASWTDGSSRAGTLRQWGVDPSPYSNKAITTWVDVAGTYHPTRDWPPVDVSTLPAGNTVPGSPIYRLPDGGMYIHNTVDLIWIKLTAVAPYPATVNESSLAGLKRAITQAAEALTQTSQTKQAFLQDRIASYNKFYEFTSNIMQRSFRDKEGIVGNL